MSLNELDLLSRLQGIVKEAGAFDELLTLEGLSGRSKISVRQLHRLLGKGLPHYRMSERGRVLILWSEFLDFLRRYRRVRGIRPADALARRHSAGRQ